MMDRIYMLMFAVLSRRYQNKLWGCLANKYGYHGLIKFGNGTTHVLGTTKTKKDFYEELNETLKDWSREAPTMFEDPNCN